VNEEAAHQFQIVHGESTACDCLQCGGEGFERLFPVGGAIFAFLFVMHDVEAEDEITRNKMGVDRASGVRDKALVGVAAEAYKLVEVHGALIRFSLIKEKRGFL
jgi:hypothetical protein